MALLDMTSSQSSFHNHFCTSRLQILLHGTTSVKLTFRKEKRLPYIPRKVNFETGHLKIQGAVLVKAVATLETNPLAQSKGHMMNDLTSLLVSDSSSQVSQYPSTDSAEMGETEKFRRIRISKANKGDVPWNKGRKLGPTEISEKEKFRRIRISEANKGNVPWNKGRKLSPETRRHIRERTKLAMQDPEVRKKLSIRYQHSQSNETRLKIGVSVRVGWERRRARMIVQESCHFEWQNLIAEASRKGCAGEDELQWDSYEVLSEQLELEWLESIERRRSNPKPKRGSRRGPKSPEQRKKISQAIATKWADPGYRERVRVAMSKHRGTPTTLAKKKVSEAPTKLLQDQDFHEQIYRAREGQAAMMNWEQSLDPSLFCSWMVLNYYWIIRLNM